MPPPVAIIAALPREIALLTAGVRPEAALLREGIHLYRTAHGCCVAAGMGAGRVALGVQAAMQTGGVEQLVSCGLAGACSADVLPGTALAFGIVVDAHTGERYSTDDKDCAPVLVTAGSIATVQEKARLAAAYGAAAVDMEAATAARLARAHGLGFRALKGISDAHDFELESLSRFAGKHGSFRTGAFALHTALRPRRWRATANLGRQSNRALSSLAAMLRER